MTNNLSKIIDNRKWILIDLKGKTLGRVSSEIASILIGKGETNYRPNALSQTNVVAINAKDIVVTGNKSMSKYYYKHSGYIGNLKVKSYKEVKAEDPTFIIKNSVYGMLPKNKLRDQMIDCLRVYSGEEHPHKNINLKSNYDRKKR